MLIDIDGVYKVIKPIPLYVNQPENSIEIEN